jgi:3-methyladenine DNA glycosylase AlkD
MASRADDGAGSAAMPSTARDVLDGLDALRTPQGIPMGRIFALAKTHLDLDPAGIEQLLDRPDHEARVAAVSVMDFQARDRRTTEARKQALFDLYLRRHDAIDTWDLVDRSAIWVVGEHLRDRPRDVLDQLAASDDPNRRRTAILATFAFIRHDDLDDAMRIAEILVDDQRDTVAKGVGWMLREVGKRDESRLRAFLDRHAATMPRVSLRYAIEKLDADDRARYLARKPAP